MTLAAFLAVCTVGAGLGLLTRAFRRLGPIVGLAGLATACVAALLIGSSEGVTIGEVRLSGSAYAGAFLACGTGTCLLLYLVGLGSSWPDRLVPAALAAFGGLGLAFAAADPAVALGAAAAAATTGAVVSSGAGTDPEERAARLSEARTLALLVGSLLFAAIAVSRPSWAAQDGPVLVLAFLALAAALATRSGAIPFHLPAARLGRRGPSTSQALVLIWIPAGIGVLAVSWSATTFGVRSDWLDLVATTVQIVAIATLVLGAVGALLHDDVTEIAVYSIVADSGFILLALASRDEGAAEPARLWLLVFIAAKTAFVAWAAAASQAFGSSSLGELRGWLRRTPILGLALVAIAAATLGWPGSAVYEARSTLISLALPDRLHFLSVVAIVLSLAYFGRLLLVGILSPVDAVTAAAGERPRWRRRRGIAAATADSSTSQAASAGLAIAADGSADRSAGDQAASAAGPAAVPGPLAPAGATTAASSDTPKPKAKRKASRSVATAEIWPAVTDPAAASLATDAAGPAGVPDSATAADTKPESASTSGEGTAAAPTVEPGLGFGSWLVSAWRLNRTLEVSGAVLAASALALVLSLGGLGASSVSRDGIPFDVAARATPTPSPTPRPTPSPRPTVTPIALPTPVPTASPSSSASSTASASPVP